MEKPNWRKAQLAQVRGLPLNPSPRRRTHYAQVGGQSFNPIARHRTHYAQGRLAQLGTTDWGLAQDAVRPG